MVYPSNHGSPLRIQRALNGVQPYQVTRFLGIIQRHSLSINIHLFPCFINVVFDRHPTIASRSLVLIIRLLASNRRVSRKMIPENISEFKRRPNNRFSYNFLQILLIVAIDTLYKEYCWNYLDLNASKLYHFLKINVHTYILLYSIFKRFFPTFFWKFLYSSMFCFKFMYIVHFLRIFIRRNVRLSDLGKKLYRISSGIFLSYDYIITVIWNTTRW